jgi:hypothetical protein
MPTANECRYNAEICLKLADETSEIYAKNALLNWLRNSARWPGTWSTAAKEIALRPSRQFRGERPGRRTNQPDPPMSAMSYVATLTWVTHRPQAQGRSPDWFESNRPSTAPAPTARLAAVFSLLPRRRGARRQPLFASIRAFRGQFRWRAFLAALRPLSALRCIVHAGKTPTYERHSPT